MQDNQNKTSLWTRLKEMLKNSSTRLRSTKIDKKIPALIMSVMMAFTPIILSACNNAADPTLPNNPDADLGTNPDNPNTPDAEDPSEGYSEILQSILKNSYYNTLMYNAGGNHQLYRSAEFDPHPYAFLQSQGHDISKIKSGELECNTRSFVLDSEPNNLYIGTYVETKAAKPYFTEYMLKYTLTDEEMDDYHMLHTEEYVQATFMNAEISANKTPTIISQTRCTVEAHDGLAASLYGKSPTLKEMLGNKEISDIILKSFDVENGTFEVYAFVALTDYVNDRKFAVLPLLNGTDIVTKNENNAFTAPYRWKKFNLGNIREVSVQDVTFYDTQNTILATSNKILNV